MKNLKCTHFKRCRQKATKEIYLNGQLLAYLCDSCARELQLAKSSSIYARLDIFNLLK